MTDDQATPPVDLAALSRRLEALEAERRALAAAFGRGEVHPDQFDAHHEYLTRISTQTRLRIAHDPSNAKAGV